MISRVDLLRLATEDLPIPPVPPVQPPEPTAGPLTIGAIARVDVPTVSPTASLGEALAAVTSSRLNRAVVVDAERHVLGVISDAEMLRRLGPKAHPTVLQALMGRLAPKAAGEAARAANQIASARVARDLMDATVPVVPAELPVAQAISTMLAERRKILPVVDEERRLIGIVDRSDLLRAVHLLMGGRQG